MKTRRFGKTNAMISEIGLGTWQLGTKWGEPFCAEEAQKILDAAYDSGITFLDTADIYNNGNSELAISKILKALTQRRATTKNPLSASLTAACPVWVWKNWIWCCSTARPLPFTRKTKFLTHWKI